MGYKRTIRFQYYQIFMMHETKNSKGEKIKVKDSIFEFARWAKAVKDEGMIMKAIDFNNAKARIEYLAYNKNNGVWSLRLMKLRDTNVPAKAKENEAARAVELEDNEYIGEDLFMIYDANKGIAMIQQNRLSLGISRIEEFLQYTYNLYCKEDGVLISIEPIVEIENITKLSKSNYKYLELSLANITDFNDDEDKKSLATLMNPLKHMHGVSGTVRVGLAHSKEETLNRTVIQELIREVSADSNKRFVRGAKIKIKEEEDADVEIIDLLEETCHDFLDFELKKREILEYRIVIDRMCTKYKNRKSGLYKLVDPREKVK